MRRAVVTLSATVAGVVGMFAYGPATTSTPPPTVSADGVGTTSSDDATETVEGQSYGTRWGDVQVAVTFSGNEIVAVQALQLPSDDGHSQMLGRMADQVLSAEVVQAQSADVDMVSGATFTSQGYLQSVQSAIDAHRS